MSPCAKFGESKLLRSIFILSMLIVGIATGAHAQYPGHVSKNADTTPTLRATGVFEWTGDLDKPKAGRLIPLTVWDGTQYQPGGLYLAQPAPLTVLTGTIYELEQAGTPKGLFNVNGAENLEGSWIAVGSVKPEMIKPKAKPPMSKHPPTVVKDAGSTSATDSDRPTLHRKEGSDSGSGSTSGSGNSSSSQAGGGGGTSTSSGTSSSDPDKPTLHRRDSSDSSSSGSTSDSSSTQSTPDADSDKPTLHRKDSSASPQNNPDIDPDRPTLHKHQDTVANNGGPVSYTANTDPDRPMLRYGKPAVQEGAVEPSKLEGLPKEMNQMAAISDVKTSELHPYLYSWADPDDAAKAKAGMEALAQKAIAAGFTTAPATQANVTKTATKTATARRKASPAPPLPALEDEKFSAFELSYNGGATLVLTAKSTDQNGEAKYVTLVAQPDFYGVPHPLFQQLTSDKALDISPRMHLIDAADTDGDGRAELIFELRGKTGRSFGIYRVVPGRAYEAFNTGPLP